jgi:hypothetical protein
MIPKTAGRPKYEKPATTFNMSMAEMYNRVRASQGKYLTTLEIWCMATMVYGPQAYGVFRANCLRKISDSLKEAATASREMQKDLCAIICAELKKKEDTLKQKIDMEGIY